MPQASPIPFPVVLFDLDHTLFDFEGSKRIAFANVLEAEGIVHNQSHLDAFEKVERPLWQALESGELTLETLNDRRFNGLVETTGLDADPARMAASYLEWLGKSGGLLPGARQLLDTLVEKCALALVSNGYGQVQRSRMTNFDLGHYFSAVTISSEIGAAKPHPSFFDHTFAQLGYPSKEQVLVVGDSLSSDIAGAINYDLAACWFNPQGLEHPDKPGIDFVVSELSEIAEIVLGP